MIKKIVTPQNNNILLSVPDSYVGKEVEVLLYTKDELNEENVKKKVKDIKRFKGIFTKEEAEKYREYIKQARSEWDRDI